MPLEKTIRYLGLAKKAGKIVSGTDTCLRLLPKGDVRLLLLTEDTAEGTREKVIRAADKYKVPWVVYGHSGDVGAGIGSPGRNIVGVCDEGFAQTIRNSIADETTSKQEMTTRNEWNETAVNEEVPYDSES